MIHFDTSECVLMSLKFRQVRGVGWFRFSDIRRVQHDQTVVSCLGEAL